MLGAEQLTVLRARHAEILARISARGGDPARVEALREQAASVDPDGWVTESDVTAGLAAVDATLLELHRIVGRRRRRRRRRRDSASAQPSVAGSADTSAAEGARFRQRAGTRRRRRRRGRRPGRRVRSVRPAASSARPNPGSRQPAPGIRARYTFCMRTLFSRSSSLLSALVLTTATLAAQTPAGQAPAQPRARRSGGPAPDFPRLHRLGDDRRDRARRHRSVRGRPHQGRVRRLRGWRQAGGGVGAAGAWRPHLQPAGPAGPTPAGRHHPAPGTSDQRRRRPHLPVLRRRPPHEFPRHVADPAAVRQDEQDAAARRRHVRRRVHRDLVDRHRPHLRQEANGRGDKEDCGQRAQAERDHPGTAGAQRQQRAEVPGARRVFDRLRHRRQPVESAEPPEGSHLRQQRLRLQPV